MENITNDLYYKQVSDHLIHKLSRGKAPWQKQEVPYFKYLPRNLLTGKDYTSINALYLRSRDNEEWITSRQAETLKGRLKEGERGAVIQYWKTTQEQIQKDQDDHPLKATLHFERPQMFLTTVFTIDQFEFDEPVSEKYVYDTLAESDRKKIQIQDILQNSDIDLQTQDKSRREFKSDHLFADNYYPNVFYKIIEQVTRSENVHPYGSEDHTKEQLRIEIASLFLGDKLNIGFIPNPKPSFHESCLEILKKDPHELFRAATDAQSICDKVLSFGQKQVQTQSLTETNTPQQRTAHQDKTWLQVPFAQKEEAKDLGAHWDRQERSWYISSDVNPAPFAQWLKEGETESEQIQPRSKSQEQERQYLAVPYKEREQAKAAGAFWDKAARSWYIGPQGDMAQLNRWLPENVQTQQSPAMTPEQEFREVLQEAGCIITGRHPIMDGEKYRIQMNHDKKGQKSGSYMGHLDNHPAGFFKNFHTGEIVKWRSKSYSLDKSHQSALQATKALGKEKKYQQQTLAQVEEEAYQRVYQQIEALLPVTTPTPYLEAKGIKPQQGVFTDQEGQTTYIPTIDINGKQWLTQYIHEEENERFARVGHKSGHFHPVGGIEAVEAAPALIISEDYATAASLSQALGYGTVAALDASNLEPVAKALQRKYPDKSIIIAGDDDKYLEFTQGDNPSKTNALAAAEAVGGKAVFPTFATHEATYPKELEPVTPESYKSHSICMELMDQSVLSKEQLEALDHMKQYTDFNDLATKSTLGENALKRQVQAAVKTMVNKNQPPAASQDNTQKQGRVQKQGRRLRAG